MVWGITGCDSPNRISSAVLYSDGLLIVGRAEFVALLGERRKRTVG